MSGYDNTAFVGDNASIPGGYRSTYFPQHSSLSLPPTYENDTNKKNKNIEYDNNDLRSNGIKGDDLNQKLSSSNAVSANVDASIITTTTTAGAGTGAKTKDRDQWGKGIEFLMSCIAMSVGLGNVWRFPFTALENGGGAFLIPYLIVLLLVGRPIYYMEMIIGQFSSRGSVKIYDCAPIMRGVGYGQILSIAIVATYYASLMALTVRYFISSFSSTLPWSTCKEEWGANCIDSILKNFTKSPNITNGTTHSSAELYYLKEILKEKDSIDDGIGLPDWSLTLCLAVSWLIVMLTLIKGVRSSGKASYFLALFPYLIMGILLIRACTLPGAMNGIIFFIKPQWNEILNPQVWYAAVTQVFFSLSVCFGNIIMYSSYNKFSHNVHRDANIVSTLDTFTSLLAGCTIFGILGHLAHEVGTDDIGSVVKGGAGLAFISYPDAIAKFHILPQAFSVLFFLMLFVLGIGSNVAMASCVITVIRDQFPKVKYWQAALVIALIGLAFGSVYVTPGGQYILNLVDFFGASNIAFILAIGELAAISWIYGLDRFCKDTEFMLGLRPNFYWRICWGFITPALMIAILAYTIIKYEPLTYRDYIYPASAYAAGWCLAALGVMQLPIWAFYAVLKQEGHCWSEKFFNAFKPMKNWGPVDLATNEKYKKFRATEEAKQMFENGSWLSKIKRIMFG